MRWVKHLTAAHDDPAISVLVEQYGAEGYGAYWLMIEHIASMMERPSKMDPSATHTDLTWANICGLKNVQKFHNVCAILVQTRLILCEDSVETVRRLCDNRVKSLRKVSIPNILKYMDEYTKKSGHTPEQSRRKADTDTEQSKTHPQTPAPDGAKADAQLPLISDPPVPENGTGKAEKVRWFEVEFWPVVWAKIGKDAALAEWQLRVHTRADAEHLIEAARVQGPDIMADALARASREGGRAHPLHPRTWLHQGRDCDERMPVIDAVVRTPSRVDNTSEVSRMFRERMQEDIDRGRFQRKGS